MARVRLGWVSERPSIDLVAALVLVLAHVSIVRLWGHWNLLSWIPLDQRLGVYGTGATVVSIVGGLCAVAITVYLGAGGDRALAVRRHYSVEVRRNWRSLLSATGVSAMLCLVAQIVDRSSGPPIAPWLFEFAVLLAVARLLRIIWLFDNLIAVADIDLIDEPRPAAPEVDPRWRDRVS
ncbi:hypothetical protein GCM10009872_12510 [Actinopolymorpha rutila]